MNFGLGLILSFTDNATAGINNAVNSLDRLTQTAERASSSLDQTATLSALSVVADRLGSASLKAGGTILSTLGQIISGVNETGKTLRYAENQLDALYGGAGKGKEVIGQIQEYAKTSMFEFENLIPAVISLKSVGIEAFDSITNSMGESKYTLLDYASALASFAPQMKNAYGTGINAAIGAFREYIAEGNALSLKRGAGIDITGILGEDKGATIEERTRQVADLVEQLGMMGMVEAMKNDPATQLSNMGDTLFQLKGMIAESGVYEKYSQLIGKLAEHIMAIPEEKLQSIAKVIGSALTTIMTPLEWVVDKIIALIDGVIALVENNPKLMKFATIGMTIAGVLLMLVGVFLKFASAMSGVSLFLLTFGKAFSSLGTVIKTGTLKILSALIPFVAKIGLLALAWKSDFAGIRTNTTYFVNGLITAFRTANKAVNGSVEDLKTTLADLRSKDDFFSNLTIGIMQVMGLMKALADGWSDYTLSEENFLKAKELGILPLVEAILDLKYRFDHFIQGFIDGWKRIGENIKTAVMGFLDNIDGTFLGDLIDKLTSFLQKLASGDAQAWYDFGQSFADITAKALALWGAFKLIGGVIKIVTKIVGVFKFLWGIVKTVIGVFKTLWGVIKTIGGVVSKVIKVFSKIGGALKWLVTGIGTVVTAILGAFGIVVSAPAWLVGAITVAVVAIIALIVKFRDKIFAVLKTIGSWIYNNVIKPVADFFVGLWNGIVNGVVTAFNAVKNFLSTIASWIYNNVVMPVVNFFQDLWNGIVNIFQNVATWFSNMFQLAVDGIKTAFSVIGDFFSGVWTTITNVFSTVAEWFGGVFSSAVEAIKSFFTPLGEFFQGVWDSIVAIFTTIGTTIADAISGAVRGAINAVLSGAVSIINGFISAINFAIDVINAIPGVSIGKLSELSVPALATGGVIESPTLAMIGEAGREAVVPLENNLGWLGKLASMISTQINSITPTNSSHISTTNQGDTNQKYLTNNTTSNQTIQGDTDNSIVFNQGAIQLNVQNASEEEAMRLARKIMEYIKRQRELDDMFNYA